MAVNSPSTPSEEGKEASWLTTSFTEVMVRHVAWAAAPILVCKPLSKSSRRKAESSRGNREGRDWAQKAAAEGCLVYAAVIREALTDFQPSGEPRPLA